MKTWKILLLVAGLAAVPLAASADSATPKAAPAPGALPAPKAKPGTTPAPSAQAGQSQEELERQLEDARRQLQDAARRVADLSMKLNGDVMSRMTEARARMEMARHRGFLGIDLDDDTDGSGAVVSGITPRGPADKAGLEEGDVITSINGSSMKASGDDSAGDKLVEFMRGTKPGDSLKVAYTRDGKAATTTVTAGSLRDFDDFAIAPIPPIPPVPPVPPVPALAPFAGLNMYFSAGSRWGEIQLVSVTPGLGTYFGTDKGLLVLHAPKDSTLQLQEGDVITQLGGRDPGTPSHAMRIIGSYGPGESVKIDIMRKGKPQTLNVTLPKERDGDNAFNWSWSSDDDSDESADGR